ncbi:putative bifunctional diguanylate cyclase/phosphodiesterase [Amorphus sp. 3PC139-8]|uniref:putative bifunctional diguanylate cyclase/phosphodiesterase n=1 Tax=Amorphus sp. 3PC139-8 TaxID=2735676 RepID=UPI00345C6C51
MFGKELREVEVSPEIGSLASLVRRLLDARGAGILILVDNRIWLGIDADDRKRVEALRRALARSSAACSGDDGAAKALENLGQEGEADRENGTADDDLVNPDAPADETDPELAAPACLVRKLARAGNTPAVGVAVIGDDDQDRNGLSARIEPLMASIGEVALQLIDGAREAAELGRSDAMMSRIETMSKTGRWHLDIKTRGLEFSDEVFRIFGLPPGPSLSLDEALELFGDEARENLRRNFEETLTTGRGFVIGLATTTAIGEQKHVRIMAEVERLGGTAVGLFGIIQDVTEEKEAERRLWWTANHDPLTGLPNRMLFHDRLARAIEHAKRFDEEIGLVILDIDNFKMVNDVYGHEAGDRLLAQISDVLLDTIRATDSIARLGGDEFAIVLGDLHRTGDIHPPLERLKSATEFAFDYRGAHMPVRMSMGVALFPEHGDTGDDLYRNADIALFRTKNQREKRLTIYEPRFGRELQARDDLLRQVRVAVEAGAIVPFYQPQFDLETGAIVGAEALARWVRSEGILEAMAFHAAIDDYETAPLIGQEITRRAAADMAAYKAEFFDAVPFSLNVSRSQIRNPDFVEKLAEALDNQIVGYHDFIVELSEDTMVDRDHAQMGERLRDLLNRGLNFSFDDFGTGFSSLVQINAYAIRQVKVDRQLIQDIHVDPHKLAIIDGIMRICSSLSIDVVAECVELEEQAQALRDLGIRHAQGNFLGRPMPFRDFLALNRTVPRSSFRSTVSVTPEAAPPPGLG